MAALMAAMAYLINRKDWDLAILLDVDALVGEVNFPRLLGEFLSRPEILLSNSWCNLPGGPFVALKREGCVRFFNCRLQGNCVLRDESSDLMLAEMEIGKIFEGRWWNPWPGIDVRQDFSVNPHQDPMRFFNCPFIRQPHPEVVNRYLDEKWKKAIPL